MTNTPTSESSKIDIEKNLTRRRVIVFGMCKPKFVQAIERLSIRKNWQPVHWIGSLPKQGDLIRERFPDIEFHSKYNLIRRRLPASIPHAEWPCRDMDVIQLLASFDPVLYPVFLREARKPYGMDQLAEYHEVITFWYYYFEYVKPDILIFGNIPEHVYDFLPYLLCLKRNIPVLMMLRHHQLPEIIMPTNRYEAPPPRIAKRYRELTESENYKNIELSGDWKQVLDKMSGSYEGAMYKSFQRRYVVDNKNNYVKLRDTIPRKLFSVLTGRRNVFYARALAREILTLHRRLLLRWSYETKTVQPDYDRPYIFVPLHAQPERTSIPQGGIFGHQLLMIEILSRTLPEGWVLYVKEHPTQLYDRPVYKLFRTPAFYKELLRFDNVQLLPSRISARKLIDHARAVAAVTSTTSWEALFRGKPSLIFGHVWFNFCDGIFHTPNYDKCKEAMAEIYAGYTVDRDKLKACLYAIQEEAIDSIPLNWHVGGEECERSWESWIDKISAQINCDGTVKV